MASKDLGLNWFSCTVESHCIDVHGRHLVHGERTSIESVNEEPDAFEEDRA